MLEALYNAILEDHEARAYPSAITVLAHELNIAMDSAKNRAAYRAVWGVEWSPIRGGVKSTAPSTLAVTVR